MLEMDYIIIYLETCICDDDAFITISSLMDGIENV